MTLNSQDNDDVKRHLLNIENRLNRLAKSPQLAFDTPLAQRNDEIDLQEIWDAIWGGKWWIIGITFLFAIGSVIFALSLPNQYKAEVVLAPAQDQAGGIGGLASQYGGLAAMAGINLSSGQGSDIDQAIALVKSWPFLDAFVDKYDIRPQVMAVKGWDSVNGQIIFDKDIYDPETKRWARESEPPKPSEPTSYEVFEVLVNMISITQDDKTGLIRMSVEHYVPETAHLWVDALVKEVNQHFQKRDVAEAARNIEYLRAKISETSIAEMQLVFYRMVESQMKTLMLAEVSNEYLLKTVIKPVIPEIKSKPKRSLICIIGVVLGVLISATIVIVLHFFPRSMVDDGQDR